MQKNYHDLETKTLVDYISQGNIIDCCASICEIVSRVRSRGMELNTDAKNAIKTRRNDDSVFWNNYVVSDFAIAALHLLGIDHYAGDRNEICGLINNKLDIL